MSKATETKTVVYKAPQAFKPLTVRPIIKSDNPDFRMMADILTYMRDHDSKTEKEFCQAYLGFCEEIFDEKGHVMAYVYKADEQPTLWSCHVDTVHHGSGYQLPKMDEEFMYFAANNQPLGADDGAGVWMLLNLIQAGVGGTYIFHRGEECGGIGSSWMASNHPEWLKQFKHAIAFDRRRDCSVITHQGGSRCCSDAFAQDFAKTLIGLKLDTGGSFTDTKNYVRLIPECTNISIGYDSEHSDRESLDFEYTVRLRDALVARFKNQIDLLCERNVSDHESLYDYSYGSWGYNSSHRYYGDGSYLENPFDPTDEIDLEDLATLSSKELRQWADCRTKQELLFVIEDLLFMIDSRNYQ